MPMTETERVELRRETYDLNEQLVGLLVRLMPADKDAAAAVTCARSAMFEAWTILCTPPEDDDDDHSH